MLIIKWMYIFRRVNTYNNGMYASLYVSEYIHYAYLYGYDIYMYMYVDVDIYIYIYVCMYRER
jgi:hypothetical protein